MLIKNVSVIFKLYLVCYNFRIIKTQFMLYQVSFLEIRKIS